MKNIRNILHVDMNNCYASIECLLNPSLRDKPVAVAGSVELRHGIILAKNQLAKACGVTTGEAVWQAEEKCPGLVLVPPHYDIYLDFSRRAHLIYERYTDRIEQFGIDECWLDVTCTRRDMFEVAEEIRNTVKNELGITVSVGGSFNKVFAKLGSDMKKPDATTIIRPENFREKVWGLPVSDMLYVGRSTAKKLNSHGIFTIGELANTPESSLRSYLGKNGSQLWLFANGMGSDRISLMTERAPVRSVSNGSTASRDLVSDEDVRMLDFALSEIVAFRLRKIKMKAAGVSIGIKDSRFNLITRQCRLNIPTNDGTEIALAAYKLYKNSYDMGRNIPIRSLTVGTFELCTENEAYQTDIFTSIEQLDKRERLNKTVDALRRKYGYRILNRAVTYGDKEFVSYGSSLCRQTRKSILIS